MRLLKNCVVPFFFIVPLFGEFFFFDLPPVLAQQPVADENEKKRAFNEGNNFIKLGRHGEALAAYEKALKIDSTWAKAHYGKGLALKGLRRYPEALRAYQNAIRFDAGFGEAYFALSRLYSDLEQYDNAIGVLQKAVARQSHTGVADFPAGVTEKIFYALGLAYDKKNQHQEAANAFRRAAELNAKNFWAFYMLGNTLNKLGEYDEALAAVENAVALKENLHLALALQAEIYNGKNQPEQALKAAQAALQARADYAPANFEAGRALKILGRYNEAETYFLQAGKNPAWKKNAAYELEDIKRLRQN
ncbi:MAG: tetratricopeptide repeat protein [candidate division KSB1 bacterium]|nr:tetratricopeptide repeat protein [candidate division KSB1 bacterium]MDZ7367405.1 tetratricopeptide repeat protein [candidate division KSB1 bacterium]MDZ7405490.1 tetratricopeptide repeat protein [candidate division KSB1 bacterium]